MMTIILPEAPLPKSLERKAETRQRILDAARGLFQERGLDGAGIAEIMAEAGLTHGGFYAHFAEKEALIAEALGAAMAEGRKNWLAGLEDHSPEDAYRRIVGRYLSRTHRDMPASGCPMPALGGDISRRSERTRKAFERALTGTIDALEHRVPEVGGLGARERAIATIALAVGGLLISRMVSDADFSDAILLACRRSAAAALSPDPASR
jgi:TetR/AcrR family transcriptional regulator, transcriptional repressor for nem operon